LASSLDSLTVLGNKDRTAFGPARDVPARISIERSSSLIRDWIAKCRAKHDTCSSGENETPALPTRVLDIEPREDASVVLIESRGAAHEYATLSHCWGEASFIQTTKQTLAQRKQCIEWDTLPRTFQDACQIVRALHIRFLWIDSLCIVQDDVLDWIRESRCMATIYSRSTLNIAATGAADSRGGCLSQRSLMHVGVESFPLQNAITESTTAGLNPETHRPTIYVRPSFDLAHHRYSTRSNYEANSPGARVAPLLSRAWIYQERHLAPRTVHFDPSEMIMECKSGFFCECTGLNKVARPRRISLGANSLTNSYRTTCKEWLEVVEEYSRLRLTRESDRLVALIGVATVFQPLFKCGYLAGLWENDVARGLLWDVARYQRVISENPPRRPQDAAAPSWSWASLILNGESSIVFPAAHDDTFRVDDRFTYLGTTMPEGVADSTHEATNNGVIHIRAPTVSAILFHPRPGDTPGKDPILVFDNDAEEDWILLNALSLNLDAPWTTANTTTTDADTVHCILIGRMEEKDWESSYQDKYLCTLVVTSSRHKEGYERIGVLDIRQDASVFQDASEETFKLD
jgi:hypothetical protein